MIIQGKIPGSETVVNIYSESGVVTQVRPYDPAITADAGNPNLYICPGFFDPQVNGFGGIDFNTDQLTAEDLHKASRVLASTGVTCFFPTLITASREKTIERLQTLVRGMEEDPLFRKMCLGIHLEGPYISPEEGFRGAHQPEFIRPPDWEEFEKFQEAGKGQIRLLTLGPETVGAIPFIERAIKEGIVIGLAHTNASEETLEDAYKAGARLSCHLGNGARALLPRHRNPIQKQLAMDGLMASVIADGVHLPDYVVKNFIRAKGVEQILLTTDSMAGAGAPPGTYKIGNLEVEISAKDGSARFPGTPYLAGSTLTMDRAIGNVIRFAQNPLSSGIQMARQNGARLFPNLREEILPGSPADMVLFESSEGIKIKGTWIHGEKVFETL